MSTDGSSVRDGRFSIGQIVHHRNFDYRGVVFDVDPTFQGSAEWYAQMAISKPPKDLPWYHVLVDGAEHTTYVAERNLEADGVGDPIRHPQIALHFATYENGRYISRTGAH